VAEGWRKLHNEELHNYNLYSSPSIIRKIKQRRIRKAGHVHESVEKMNILLENQKEPIGKSRRRWVDNIKMGLREMRSGAMDLINLAQDRDR
jgi:hypothetical protein